MTNEPRAEGITCGPFIEPSRFVLTVALLSLASVLTVRAQVSQTPASQTSGSVTAGAVTPEVRRLTLRDAIEMALRYNLGAIESDEATRIAKGQRVQALSALLPQFSFSA